MDFFAADTGLVKQLRLDQIIKYFACGELEITPVVIRLLVTGLKKAGLVYLLDLFGGRREEG